MNRLTQIAYLILLIVALLCTSTLGQEIDKKNGEDNNTTQQQEEAGVEPLYRMEVLEDGTIKIYDMQGNLVDTTMTKKMKNDTESLRNENETGPPSKNLDEIKKGPELKEEKVQEVKSEEGINSKDVNEGIKGPELKEEKVQEVKSEEGINSKDVNEGIKGPDLKEEKMQEVKSEEGINSKDVNEVIKGPDLKEEKEGGLDENYRGEQENDLYKKTQTPPENVDQKFIVKFTDENLAVKILNENNVEYQRENNEFILDDKALEILKIQRVEFNVIGKNIIIKGRQNNQIDEENPSPEQNFSPSNQSSLVDPFIFGNNTTDFAIPDYSGGTPGYAWSGVSISGATSGSVVTNVEYRVRVLHTFPADLRLYIWNSSHQILVWNHLGGTDDGGFDDDPEFDEDIYLNWRQTSFFNGDNPNRLWTLDCYDDVAGDIGNIDYIEFRIYYSAGDLNLASYTGTGSVNTYSYSTSTHVVNSTVSVGNFGTGPAGSFRTGWYLSDNTIISIGDYLIMTATQSSLAAGFFINKSASADLDVVTPVVPAGTYYLGFIFDDLGQVVETDETDNDYYFTPSFFWEGLPLTINLASYTGTGSVNTYSYSTSTHVVNSTVSVGNFGTGPAGSFRTGWYLSDNTIISIGDYLIMTATQSSLAAGFFINKSASADLDVVTPVVPAGTYYLGFIFDDLGQVVETDETDNDYYFTPSFFWEGLPLTINLASYTGTGSVNTYSYSTSTHVVNSTVSVGNFGTGPAGSFRTGWYLSDNTIISIGDYLIMTATQSSLAAGFFINKSASADLDVVTPVVPAGTYYLGFIFDDLGQVVETDETDNDYYFTPSFFWEGLPLTINLASYTGTGSVNTYSYSTSTHVVNSTVSVGNFGTGPAGSFRTGWYLSDNTIISIGDYLIMTATQSSLAAGFFINKSASADLDVVTPVVPAGTYYLGFIFDDLGQVVETDETDNDYYFTPSFFWEGLPPSINLTTYTGSGSINTFTYNTSTHVVDVTNSVANNGGSPSGSFRAGWYLSLNTVITTTDELIITSSESGLADGSFRNVGPLTVDLDNINPPAGTYYLGNYWDDTFLVTETDETDNTGVFTSPQITWPPDTDIVISGTITESGSGVSGVTVTFNPGGTTTTNSSGFYTITLTQPYSGTATPGKQACTFSPPNRTYTGVTTNQTNENYTANCTVCICGDADGSGVVQAFDAALVLRYVLNLPPPLPTEPEECFDPDGNGNIQAFDAALILFHVLGLDVPDPNCWGESPDNNIASKLLNVGVQIEAEDLNQKGNATEVILGLSGFDISVGVSAIQMDVELPDEQSNIVLSELPAEYLSGVNKVEGNTYRIGIVNPYGIDLNDVKLVLTSKSAESISILEFSNVYLNALAHNNITAMLKGMILPVEYSLGTYPNPFNPSTKIKYTLPEKANVEIRVFDILGREVVTLINNEVEAGTREVEWGGTNNYGSPASSGIYIVTMKVGNYFNAIKVNLLK